MNKSPIYILIWYYIISFFLVIGLSLIIGLIASSDGLQLPLIFLAYSIDVVPAIGVIFCVSSFFTHQKWNKKYWFITILAIFLQMIPIYFYLKDRYF